MYFFILLSSSMDDNGMDDRNQQIVNIRERGIRERDKIIQNLPTCGRSGQITAALQYYEYITKNQKGFQ